MSPKREFPACDVALDASAQLISTNGALILLVNIVGPFYPSIILRQGDKAQKLTLRLLEESQGVMTEQTHTVLQEQYDNLVLTRHGLKGGWKLKQLELARRYRDRAMRLKGQTVTLSQIARSDGMWKEKGKPTVLARFRLAKKAKSGRPHQDGDNASISSDVPLLRISTIDSNITTTSDGVSVDTAEQAPRTYVTHLDSAWMGHAHHHHHHHHHDAQSDSDESDDITIELESDNSDANDEDSGQDDTDGTSSSSETSES